MRLINLQTKKLIKCDDCLSNKLTCLANDVLYRVKTDQKLMEKLTSPATFVTADI